MSTDTTETDYFASIDKTVYLPKRRTTETADPDDPDTGKAFKPGQREWAAQFDPLVYEYLMDYFEVTEDDIYDIEGLHDGNRDVPPEVRIIQELDYTGLDKIIKCPNRTISFGFRVRPQNLNFTVDFSYCCDNGREESVAEFHSHLTAYRSLGMFPNVYTFGIVNEAETAFDEFHLIDVAALLGAVDSGALETGEPRRRDGDVWAYYFPVADLREHGCIIESWDGPLSDESD